MKIDENNPNHITAEPGMVFQRISDKQLFGTEIMLGYMHYIGGVLQDPPVLATPEHFEEVDEELFGPSEDATM